ncbi:MAG: hypothetical protein K8R87_09755 [Verrucomicrobia bacterium]|nr:hypothetical protein [Verrucomicrobiota bacterium]
MKPLLYITIAALLVLGVIFLRTPDEKPSESEKLSAPVAVPKPASNTEATVVSPVNPPPTNSADDEESSTAGSPLAAKLNATDSTPQQDVDTLHELILQYQHNMRHPNAPPIGDDSDLARALTGHNPLNFVIIPPGHPAISQDGHLRDRWGTPYFIHPTGGNAFEIRSSGPDKKRFTADDVIASP